MTNSWTINLETEGRPIIRAGIHGLWRLLTYGEKSPRYPDIRQTDTLRWKMDDTSITIEWESYEDLHALMNCMLGNFHDGIAVPPGYETDPNKPGFYVTARQHQGITQLFFTKKGMYRSRSLGKSSDKDKKVMRAEWTRARGQPPCEQVCNLTSTWGDKPLELTVTPHKWEKAMLLAPTNKTTGVQTVARKYAIAIHPALGSWNKADVKATPQDIFIASFSCLSYVFTMSDSGVVGLAIDAPTFLEADKYHEQWAGTEEPQAVLWVGGDVRSAMWVLASSIDLPPATYLALSSRGSTLFHVDTIGNGYEQLYAAMGASMETASKNGFIRQINRIPITSRKGTRGDSKTKYFLDVFIDKLVSNLEAGFPFYVGMDGIHTTKRNDNDVGLYARERNLITIIGETLMTDIERQVATWMRNRYAALGAAFTREGRGDSWSRARDFAISTHLNRASNRAGILEALNAIGRKADNMRIPQDVFNYIWTRAEKNPTEVRALLIMSCGLLKSQAAAPDATDSEAILEEPPTNL